MSSTGFSSSDSVTFNLLEVYVNEEGYYELSSTPWRGSGAYNILIQFENEVDVESEYWPVYVYTNGTSEQQKYNISSATSTIAFNKFIKGYWTWDGGVSTEIEP